MQEAAVFILSGLRVSARNAQGLNLTAVIRQHEIAHLVLVHTNQRRTSERHEAEADYLGLYFAALAGYDIEQAPEIWDKFARKNPYSFIDWGFYRHPLSAQRSRVSDDVYARLSAEFTAEQIVALTAFGAMMVATNVFNNALDVDLDEYLEGYRKPGTPAPGATG